jgi:hypothetical protein
MKPSERIEQLATEWHRKGVDPCFNGNVPDVTDYLNAIIGFLDEQGDKAPLYTIQPMPEPKDTRQVTTSNNTLDPKEEKP